MKEYCVVEKGLGVWEKGLGVREKVLGVWEKGLGGLESIYKVFFHKSQAALACS